MRGGERQARGALRLVVGDPTVRWLVLLQALALLGLSAAYFLLNRDTGSFEREADRVFARWVYWFAAGGIATVFSVAVACTVDAKIDGVEGGLWMAFDEVRRRLPAVLWWWLISMGCVIGLGYGTEAVMEPLLAFLVSAVIWDIASFFVVPAIVLRDGGPLVSLGEALRLLRARLGRALAGLFVIGFLFGLVFIAAGFLLRAIHEGHPRAGDDSFLRFAGPLLVVYLVYALAAATRGGFALILARDELGDLPGGPPAVKPRRRGWKGVRRIALAAVALMVGLVVLGAILHHYRSNPAPTTPQTSHPVTAPSPVASRAPASFAAPLREPGARLLQPGAPVTVGGRTIGHVYMVHVERPPLVEVFFETDPRVETTVIHAQKRVAVRHGRAHLRIVPDAGAGAS